MLKYELENNLSVALQKIAKQKDELEEAHSRLDMAQRMENSKVKDLEKDLKKSKQENKHLERVLGKVETIVQSRISTLSPAGVNKPLRRQSDMNIRIPPSVDTEETRLYLHLTQVLYDRHIDQESGINSRSPFMRY